MATGSLGLASEQLAPDGRGGRFAVGRGLGGVAQDQGTPVAERVGIVGVGLVEGLVLRGGLGELLILVELGDQGQPQVAASRGQLDRLFVPALGLGGAPHGGERPAEPDQGLDVLGLLLGPVFVVGDEAGLVVVAEEDFLDLAAHFAMEPAIGPELGQHRSRSPAGPGRTAPSSTFKSAACMANWTCRNGSVAFLASASKRGRA